jgi:hypothetical protein
MNAPGFRLRTVLIVIATLAVLLGLGRMIRPGPMRGIYEYLVSADHFGSQRARFDLQRWEVWIWVDETVDGNGIVKEINYVCVPMEYVVTITIILAAPVILTVDYLARRRTDISLQDAASTDLRAGPRSDCFHSGQRAVVSLTSVRKGQRVDSPRPRLRTLLIVIATFAVLMILAATVRRGVPLQPHTAKNSKSAAKSSR